jgi:hypothetical protein
LLLPLLHARLDEVDVPHAVRGGVRGGAADRGHDRVVLLDHVVRLLHVLIDERVALA